MRKHWGVAAVALAAVLGFAATAWADSPGLIQSVCMSLLKQLGIVSAGGVYTGLSFPLAATGSTPQYSFSGDTDTGIGHGVGNTNIFTFVAGNGESGRVTTSGVFATSGLYLGWNTSTRMLDNADGQLILSNAASNDFSRLMFGSNTSSFPALKRSGTTLQVKLADDSAPTGLDAGIPFFSDTGTLPYAITRSNANMIQSWQSIGVTRCYYANATPGMVQQLGSSKGTTASPTAIASGDLTAAWESCAYIGATSGHAVNASIRFYEDGTPTDNSSNPGRIDFQTTPSGSLTPTTRVRLNSAGSLIVNATGANLAQNATDGFLYVPVCATGAPSGTPTSVTGAAPVVVQGTTLYFYGGGSWQAVSAGGGTPTLSSVLGAGATTGGSAGSHSITFTDADNIVLGTSTGTKIGTGTTQKLGFYNATPVAQISGSTDVLAGLVTLGLRAASSNPPLNLGSGAITCGSLKSAASSGSWLAVQAGGGTSGEVYIGGAALTGTNTANSLGLLFGTSIATGTGAPGDTQFYSSTRTASGSTSQSQTHWLYARGQIKTLTDNTATRFADISLNPATDTDAHGGGCIVYFTAQANDGTNYQSITGSFIVSWVTNASNTATADVSAATTQTRVTSGTITATPTVAIGSPGVRISMNVDSSLTPTTMNMQWTIVNLGASSIGAQ